MKNKQIENIMHEIHVKVTNITTIENNIVKKTFNFMIPENKVTRGNIKKFLNLETGFLIADFRYERIVETPSKESIERRIANFQKLWTNQNNRLTTSKN